MGNIRKENKPSKIITLGIFEQGAVLFIVQIKIKIKVQ